MRTRPIPCRQAAGVDGNGLKLAAGGVHRVSRWADADESHDVPFPLLRRSNRWLGRPGLRVEVGDGFFGVHVDLRVRSAPHGWTYKPIVAQTASRSSVRSSQAHRGSRPPLGGPHGWHHPRQVWPQMTVFGSLPSRRVDPGRPKPGGQHASTKALARRRHPLKGSDRKDLHRDRGQLRCRPRNHPPAGQAGWTRRDGLPKGPTQEKRLLGASPGCAAPMRSCASTSPTCSRFETSPPSSRPSIHNSTGWPATPAW